MDGSIPLEERMAIASARLTEAAPTGLEIAHESAALLAQGSGQIVAWRQALGGLALDDVERLRRLSDAALHASGGTVTTGAELSEFIAAQADSERWRIAEGVREFIKGAAPSDAASFLYIVADRIEEDSLGDYGSKSTIADLRRRAFFKDLDHAEVIRPMRRDFFRALDDAEVDTDKYVREITASDATAAGHAQHCRPNCRRTYNANYLPSMACPPVWCDRCRREH